MPTYNIQHLADKINYLIRQGLDKAEAELKAFRENGLFGRDQLPKEVQKALDDRIANPTVNSPLARNDRDSILDRRTMGTNVPLDTNPNPTTNPADAGQNQKKK